MSNFQEIIKEICDENNIKFELISKNWIIKLEKNNLIRYIVGMRFPLNDYASAFICNDKYATYEALTNAKIPIVEHKLIYNKKFIKKEISDLENEAEIEKYVKKYDRVVVKDNMGTEGINVFLCNNTEDVLDALSKIFELRQTAVISPFLKIANEYRCICIDDECKLVFEKIRQSGEWRHNLSNGAIARIVYDEKMRGEVAQFALNVMRKLNLRFASVDLIRVNNEISVLEVNSGVCMSKFMRQVDGGRKNKKNIYCEAIKKMFE